jgi:general secretion pathway protein I
VILRTPTARPPAGRLRTRGFTLIEVMVALMIVAMGLTALMVAVSGTASASGYLRDKAIAQWIALNRLTEVRLNLQQKPGQNGDTGELDVANRKWHYDTRYFDTDVPSMHRVVVRVWAGPADQKGNPLGEYTGFLGSDVATPGGSNVDWTQGSNAASSNCVNGTSGTPNNAATNTPSNGSSGGATTPGLTNCTPIGGTGNSSGGANTPGSGNGTTNTGTGATPTTNPQ